MVGLPAERALVEIPAAGSLLADLPVVAILIDTYYLPGIAISTAIPVWIINI